MWCLVVHSLDHSVRIRLDTQHVFCAQTRARSHACDNIFCSRCICLLLACSPRGKKKKKKTVISAGYSPRHFLWEMVNKRRPREASRSVRSPKDTLQIMSQCTSPQQTRPRCLCHLSFCHFTEPIGTDRRKKIPRGWTNVCDSEITLL